MAGPCPRYICRTDTSTAHSTLWSPLYSTFNLIPLITVFSSGISGCCCSRKSAFRITPPVTGVGTIQESLANAPQPLASSAAGFIHNTDALGWWVGNPHSRLNPPSQSWRSQVTSEDSAGRMWPLGRWLGTKVKNPLPLQPLLISKAHAPCWLESSSSDWARDEMDFCRETAATPQKQGLFSATRWQGTKVSTQAVAAFLMKTSWKTWHTLVGINKPSYAIIIKQARLAKIGRPVSMPNIKYYSI